MSQFITTLTNSKNTTQVGQKATSLAWLQQANFTIPQTLVCTTNLFDQWKKDQTLPANFRSELTPFINPNKKYAIRSSSNFEDTVDKSFAGQYESVLDVESVEAVCDAIEHVLASAGSERVLAYAKSAEVDPNQIKMAVIVQEMVTPVVSGVAFTKNPITGFDELIIEAVEGGGDQLVQGIVTPARWLYKWGKWMTVPQEPFLTAEQIDKLQSQIDEIASQYKQPADIEWVFDGEQFYFVQIRPITTLQTLAIYSNRISKEVLPGIILPLIWSVNIPLVNTAWINLFTELIGSNELEPEDLSKAFHYRAYFNMGAIGVIFDAMGMQPETLEVMIGLEGGDQRPSFRPSMKVLRHMPRMLKFGWQKWRYAAEIERTLPVIKAEYSRIAELPFPENESGLLKAIDHLYNVSIEMAYLNIVGPLLAQLYTSRFNSQLEKAGIDPTTFDFRSDSPEFEPFDPNFSLEHLNQLFSNLSAESQTHFTEAGLAEIPDSISADLGQFMKQFGHMSDSSNDFSQVPWRENLPLVKKMITNFSKADSAGESVTWSDLQNQGKVSRKLRNTHQKAKQFQLYREEISSTYIFGYGQFRNYFRKLGQLWEAENLIDSADDIFYLFQQEIRQACADQTQSADLKTIIQTRKDEIDAVAEAIMPETIYGDVAPPIQTALEQDVDALNGVPTSPGYYQGPARIITKASEFEKVQSGDILVIPFSDVSWTPLFAKAGAIIAESGGMLSHSSIVAREYGLPAVVSVPSACLLFADGEEIQIDGYQGVITKVNGDKA